VLVALYVDPNPGGYLVAFALIGHAGWDAYRYLRNRVVARSYAGWFAVVDLLVGAAILLSWRSRSSPESRDLAGGCCKT
jgi:hypothetical protein